MFLLLCAHIRLFLHTSNIRLGGTDKIADGRRGRERRGRKERGRWEVEGIGRGRGGGGRRRRGKG